ncbi:hypothetical protein DSO57_1010891 [Entomophthora muscae]|uniref:Uncharacterized protein n=1 Tax=Entomophthora muscae TaxID=34485 RepID=A0ACC2T6N1_9FUNG|nr:hypothetical protein DSO57_1010891 [Entomophthora muscae]
MKRALDEVKKEHILTCLHLTCQEVVVSELPTIETWEDMKQLLIDKIGGYLSLEVKKDAFMYIAFKPKETLAEFSDGFYIEGQQLITSLQLTAHEAYMACAQALKVNQLLCLYQNSSLDPRARFQTSRFVTRNLITQPLEARVESQLELQNLVT